MVIARTMVIIFDLLESSNGKQREKKDSTILIHTIISVQKTSAIEVASTRGVADEGRIRVGIKASTIVDGFAFAKRKLVHHYNLNFLIIRYTNFNINSYVAKMKRRAIGAGISAGNHQSRNENEAQASSVTSSEDKSGFDFF